MKKQIDSIVLHNYKKHGDYKGNVNGKHFLLIGKNGVGKTSVLDWIKRGLGMKVKTPKRPVKEGAEKGVAGMHLAKNGEKYMVEERYNLSGGGRIKFYKVTGDRRDELTPAMERFVEIFGEAPLDFAELMDLDGKKQYEWFLENLKLDISNFETQYNNIYDSRTLVNRQLETAYNRLNDPERRIVKADKDLYKEEKKLEDIIEKQKKSQHEIAETGTAIDAVNKEIKKFDEEQDAAKQLAIKIEELQKQLNEKNAWIKKNPRPDKKKETLLVELETQQKAAEGIYLEITQAGEHNKMVQKVKDHIAAEEEANAKKKESDKLTGQLNELKEKIKKALADFKLGEIVPGLDIKYQKDDGGKVIEQGLFLDGLPFNRNQIAYGDLLKAVVKLSSYFNADKAINFIAIGDWNLLDEDNQADILKFVRENEDLEIQLAIEKVDNNKQIITQIIDA